MAKDIQKSVEKYTFYSKRWDKKFLKEIIAEEPLEASLFVSHREYLSKSELSAEQKAEVEKADKRFANRFDEELLELFENSYPETELKSWWSK
ncbi:hypothetical protein IT568_00010 [bacterium]|nr:hypothetical protein [bacterium]